MAKYQIKAPDGSTYSITAPDSASEKEVLAYAQQHFSTPQQESAGDRAPAAAPKPELGMGERAADFAKSLGVGAVQGVLGAGSMPGNIELLGRMGIDKAATALGYEDPGLSQPDPAKDGRRTYMPAYGDYKADLEQRIGTTLYEPKTTAGKYARTSGEFLPMAAGGGSLVARATRVEAPAVLSETAGQATEGTWAEPYARVGGAIAGVFAPNAAARVISPNPISPERARQVGVLRNEGVTDITAGQETGRRPLMWAESSTQDMPFAGARAATQMEQQAEQFTRAALRRAGENSPRATSDVMDQAFTRIGQQFDDLAARNTMVADARFANDIQNVVAGYNQIVNPSARAPIINDTVQDVVTALQQNGGRISGEAYQALRSRLDKAARSTRQGDPQLSEALFGLRHSLDDAMGRSITPADQAAWQQARGQYRNMLILEKAATSAGSNAAEGLISPSALRNATVAQNRRDYARGRGDMADLARAGEAVLKPLPQSGTAPRAYAQGALSVLGGVGGGAVAGIPGAIAGVAAPALTARALMSRPVQGYLRNQTMAPMALNRMLRGDPRRLGPGVAAILEDE